MATSLVWLSTQHQFERFLPRDSYKTHEIKLFPSLSPCKFSHSRVFAHVQHFLCTLTIGNYLKPDPESAVWKINTWGASWGLCKHGMEEWVQRLSLWEVSISSDQHPPGPRGARRCADGSCWERKWSCSSIAVYFCSVVYMCVSSRSECKSYTETIHSNPYGFDRSPNWNTHIFFHFKHSTHLQKEM